ncbi:sulfite exporter TauE/SafE family protein [bacterium]|nr:sulfite exporter TauE/SafE family protein [bacterium]
MIELLLAALSAFWLGILTSISPCPLTANIAAISYIGGRIDKPSKVLLGGLLYTLGRIIVYLGLGIAIVYGATSIPGLSFKLQSIMEPVLGPLFIVVGLLLLGLFTFNIGGKGMSDKMRVRIDKMGIWGAIPLGIILGLAFCPVSAALFFGSLIPLAIERGDPIILPSLYGLGTGAPVIVFAFLFAFAAHRVAAAYKKITSAEIWIRRITGAILMLLGLYLTAKYFLL